MRFMERPEDDKNDAISQSPFDWNGKYGFDVRSFAYVSP